MLPEASRINSMFAEPAELLSAAAADLLAANCIEFTLALLPGAVRTFAGCATDAGDFIAAISSGVAPARFSRPMSAAVIENDRCGFS